MEEKIEASHIVVERVINGVCVSSMVLTHCQVHVGINLQPITGGISTIDSAIILTQKDLINIYSFLQAMFKRLNIEVEEIESVEIVNSPGNTNYA